MSLHPNVKQDWKALHPNVKRFFQHANLVPATAGARLESVFSKCESCYADWRSKIANIFATNALPQLRVRFCSRMCVSKIANLLSRIRKQNFTICSFSH